MNVDGINDVDIVITTRELARMIKEAGINFTSLPDEGFDPPFGEEATGAAVIFGVTGGVMEAALRTAADILEGKSLTNVDYHAVRGTEGIKVAEVEIAGLKLKAAVAHGLGNARELLNRARAGEQFHVIEVMACPGGCVTGGGQPIRCAGDVMDVDLKKERAKALYSEDMKLAIRKSHENPYVKKLYEEYLGEPGGHKAHKLLHTHYHKRDNY
jgi:NADP-reducing hydrogenase subunit HndD